MAGRPIDILLVDDSPADVWLTRDALSRARLDSNVMAAHDGAEALAMLRRGPTRPDLILLDLNMPRMDGREFLAEIKADTELKMIPVIVLTTSDAERDASTCYRSQCGCYITKPVTIDEFNHVIEQVSAFWGAVVRLPARTEAAMDPAERAGNAGGSPSFHTGRRAAESRPVDVLLIEDQSTHAMIIEEALSAAGVPARLQRAVDGCEALAMLRREGKFAAVPRPDMILLDVIMPRKSGHEVLAEVKQDDDLKSIPIVVLSSADGQVDVLTAYRHMANCFVAKPDSYPRFREAVAALYDFWLTNVRLPRKSEEFAC